MTQTGEYCGKCFSDEFGCVHCLNSLHENQRELLAEELECVHLWLDDKAVDRDGPEGTLSVVGRVQALLSGAETAHKAELVEVYIRGLLVTRQFFAKAAAEATGNEISPELFTPTYLKTLLE